MRTIQRYRMRTPSTGRESIVLVDPEKEYVDSETGETPGGHRGAASAGANRVRAALGDREPAVLQSLRPASAEGSDRLSVVRAADGSGRTLGRLAGRDGRGCAPWFSVALRVALACAAVLAGLGLAACGGGGSGSGDTTGAPPLTVPTTSQATPPASTASANSNTDTTATSGSSDTAAESNSAADTGAASDSSSTSGGYDGNPKPHRRR